MRTRSNVPCGVDTPPLHFVYHVPKCAGRTIDRHLASALPASAYHRLRKRRGMGRLMRRYDRTHLPDPGTTLVVSGHHLGISLDPLFENRLIKRSLLLRDPASHFVSYYNYRMTRYINEGLQPYGVEVAYGAMRRNFITHYILENFLELSWVQIASLSDQDKYELANAFLSMFWFVGDYTLCDDFLSVLGERIGIPANAQPHNMLADLARGAGWTPLTLDLVPKDIVAEIQADNWIDQRLWETWRDARHETASIRPIALESRASSFISGEAVRFVNQIVRRVQRRWGNFGAEIPVPQGDRVTLA
ncbi:hypothetical protein [Methyloceanibacter sp.]|uniref:hypothetical protein n=1 Tax=Methyloceanibacter sp. TaxID=1965321 RepID=UPI002B6254DE|nr:hypothetical protein [Methyloceanibacter sp.]HML91441.1 hypothetical protein [Methyloceanibacter sp.]